MTRPTITFACGVYDRTVGVFDGSIQAEGLNVNPVEVAPGELFSRQARHGEFDAAEFSLATLMILHARGDDRLVGIPAHVARRFRHEHIWVNRAAGIKRPEDLRGRRVGVQEFIQTASVWIRGILGDDYGVTSDEVRWYVGGYNSPDPEFRERIPLELHGDLDVRRLGSEQCINDMLVAGELDAAFPGRLRALSERPDLVEPLFPDYREVEADYFRRRGIFPIMHVVVLRRDVYERYPWAAASLYKMLELARQQSQRRLTESPGPLHCSLPWLTDHLRHTQALMGPAYWSYGLRGNEQVLTTLARYLLEQGLIPNALSDLTALFAPEALDMADALSAG